MSDKPTGERRHRLQRRLLRAPVLVLQLEFTGTRFESLGGHVDSFDVRYWRDARPEDGVF